MAPVLPVQLVNKPMQQGQLASFVQLIRMAQLQGLAALPVELVEQVLKGQQHAVSNKHTESELLEGVK